MVDILSVEAPAASVELICLDLDGTLLDSSKQVSDGNRSAIRRALDSGVAIAIASGRHPFNVAETADGLGLPHTAVCLSGAYAMLDGREVFRHAMGDEDVRHAIDVAERYGCYISLAGSDFNLCAGSVKRAGGETPATRRYMRLDGYAALRNEAGARSGQLLKAALHHDDPKVYEAIKQELSSIEGVEAAQSDACWCDVLAKGCSKAEGVAALARAMGCGLDKVAAIGDDENDVDLIGSVGLGIAMGNALPEVKAVAKARTLDNDHDGVAHAIDAILEKRRAQ